MSGQRSTWRFFTERASDRFLSTGLLFSACGAPRWPETSALAWSNNVVSSMSERRAPRTWRRGERATLEQDVADGQASRSPSGPLDHASRLPLRVGSDPSILHTSVPTRQQRRGRRQESSFALKSQPSNRPPQSQRFCISVAMARWAATRIGCSSAGFYREPCHPSPLSAGTRQPLHTAQRRLQGSCAGLARKDGLASRAVLVLGVVLGVVLGGVVCCRP